MADKTQVKFKGVTSTPTVWDKDTFYAVYLGGDTVDCYITSYNGIPRQVGNADMITAIFNDLIGAGGIVTVVDNNTNPDRHLISTVDGKQILETVVSLQDFTLNDNILSLTLNNEDGDEQTVSVDLTDLNTDLGYTPSPTNGVVTNTAGDNATIPLADETNAGLLSPQEKERIDSAIQHGDNISELTNDSGFITLNDIPPEYFTYEQTTPSDKWTFQHPLGRKVSVTVTDSAGTVMEGQVTLNTGTEIEIQFNVPFWGYAYLI